MTLTTATDHRVLWMRVGKIFQDGSNYCEDCSHCAHEETDVPYGEGWTSFSESECTLSGDPMKCPALADRIAEEQEFAA